MSQKSSGVLVGMGIFAFCLGLSPWASAQASPPLARLQCLSIPSAQLQPSLLPRQIEAGVETIHRDSERVITAYLPLPGGKFKGPIGDLNSNKNFKSTLPPRFVTSDGTVQRAFIGFDQRPGTRLDACIAEVAQVVLKATGGDRESIFRFLEAHIQDYLRPVAEGVALPWDRGLSESEHLKRIFASAANDPVGRYPRSSGVFHPVIPFEAYLKLGYGYCVEKAIFTSMILERLGIAHRLVSGGTQETGHTWIQLQDGRVLDPTWQVLDQPSEPISPSAWFRYGTTWVFEDQIFPYLILN